MMKHGPVDVVVLAFGEARFDGSALAELERQAAAGTIRVLDLIILLKDENEECWRIEVSDLPPGVTAEITPEVVDAGETAELTLNSNGMALGEYAFKISGASGGTTRSQVVKLYVVEEVHEMSLPVVGKS